MNMALFQFQQSAASQIADRYLEYDADPAETGRKSNRRIVPFYQALSSLTGSGKTAILAEAVSQIAAASAVKPIILWLSKGKVVVQQSFSNLSAGGKYSHLLGDIEVRLLSDYRNEDVESTDGSLLYFATVGTFNQSDRNASGLRIFKSDIDGTESTRWDALKLRPAPDGSRRPLVVVYDEAQNLSDQQTRLLLEQGPRGFLLASATLRFPAEFNEQVIESLRREADMEDEDLITHIPTSEVVASGLVKSTVVLEGLNSSMEEAVSDMLTDLEEASIDARAEKLGFEPKAIYVANTNMVSDDAQRADDPKKHFGDRQAPPILIWRFLTETKGIPASKVAVYADLKTDKNYPLPEEFNLFSGGEGNYEAFIAGDYQHVIFNLSLQEGWDDPSVYFAYIDKSMDSSIQVTQVVGRVLRQPNATHYSAERLNTASFYVRVDRNDVFNTVVEDVQSGLGGKTPDIRVITRAPGGAKPVELPVRREASIPRANIENAEAAKAVVTVLSGLMDYTRDTTNTVGIGNRRIVQQSVGEETTEDSDWEEFEQSSQVSVRWAFRREVARRYRPSLTAMSTDATAFDARIGFGSVAFKHVVGIAEQAVKAYLQNAVIKQGKVNPYVVGPILARPESLKVFVNSLHEGYDWSRLNDTERAFAEAIDLTGHTWARNSTSGYRLPLITQGSSTGFFPDFAAWVGEHDVYLLDTKGAHLIEADARRKLLSVRPNSRSKTRLHVVLVTGGKWEPDGSIVGPDGWSAWRLSNSQELQVQTYEDLRSMFSDLLVSHEEGE